MAVELRVLRRRHHGYDNVESGPAEIVGTTRGKKLLRLRFIPFVYATPTYDNVV